MNLRTIRRGVSALALLVPSLAFAQGSTPLHQSGTVTPGHLLKAAGNGLQMDAGGTTGDINGRGVSPFSITDGLGAGLCSNTAVTGGQHYAFCLGHDSDGNALLTVTANGGALAKNLKLNLNGSTYDLPGAGTGNVSGPVSTTSGNLAIWNGTSGTNLANSDIGTIVPSITIPSGAIAGAVPGFHLPSGIGFRKNTATATDGNNVLIARDADFTGGAVGFVNAALQVTTVTHPGITSYEWPFLSYLYNQGTYADASQNTAVYGRASKLTTGGTWAATFECSDHNTAVALTNPCVAIEADIYANGADPGTNRTGIHIVANKRDPAGSIPVVQTALKIGVGAAYGTFTQGVQLLSTYDVGLDFRSATFTSAGLWLPDGAPVIWDTDGTSKTFFNSGTDCTVFATTGNAARQELCISGGMDATDGTVKVSFLPLSASSVGIVETTTDHDLALRRNEVEKLRLTTAGISVTGALTGTGAVTALNATAIPAGGTAGSGFLFSSTANYGVFFGSGVPTLSAAQGSLYLRSDGSSTSTRVYVNSDGGTTWVAITTAS